MYTMYPRQTQVPCFKKCHPLPHPQTQVPWQLSYQPSSLLQPNNLEDSFNHKDSIQSDLINSRNSSFKYISPALYSIRKDMSKRR
jgi:hypothetical protein